MIPSESKPTTNRRNIPDRVGQSDPTGGRGGRCQTPPPLTSYLRLAGQGRRTPSIGLSPLYDGVELTIGGNAE